MEARPPESTRRGQLPPRELRSASRKRTDEAGARRLRGCSGYFAARVSRTHPGYADDSGAKRWANRLLHFRPDSNQRPYRPELGHGLRSLPARDHRKPSTLLRTGVAGEVADHVYPRSADGVGPHREGRKRQDERAAPGGSSATG